MPRSVYARFHRMQDEIIRAAMPYPEGRFEGRGIVVCAGGPRLFTCAWVGINMLRRVLGCTLPIQVWYLGPEEMDARMVALLGTLGVECVDAYEVRIGPPARKLGGWECKPYAILHSPFQEVILLDADNVPIVEPTFLFETEAYRETGAVFWPDIGGLAPRSTIWAVCRVPYRREPPFESGQMVIDKARSWKALALTMHLNEHSDFYYQHMNGDKETFHMAWRMLDQPYGMPPHPPRPLRSPLPAGQVVHALRQHDFQGRAVFQHRLGAKWILRGVNCAVPGFQYHEECMGFLRELADRWDGRVAGDGGSPLTSDTPATPGRWFRYVRVSSDERRLELLPDHRIGRGGSRCERRWRVIMEGGSPRLEILGDRFVTCRLARHADGVWRGRWLRFERMPVELTALSPDGDAWIVGGEPPAAPSTGPIGKASCAGEAPIDAVYLRVNGQSGALTVRGPYKGASGHDHHVREFVRHLARRGIRQQLIDVPEWGSRELPPRSRDPWFDTLGAPVESKAVLHFCMPHQVRPARGRLNVNYTMFEANRIPGSWVRHNLRHDLVILPTASSREAWVESGFPAERIRLCPLGVDPARFHPAVEPLPLDDRQGRPVREYRTRVLNVSEISPRKNLLGLLRVWLRATTRDDDAILILKVGRQPPGCTVLLMRDLDALERAIGKTRRESAPVLFSDQVFPDPEMPSLFAAATHYWSMSHGEGWDQPMVEAGATGLRLIAPMHSAYTAYLDASVARMIPARLVPARLDGGGRVGPPFEGMEWWEPDEEAAGEAIREALSGADHGSPTPRARIAADLTWEKATDRLIAILDELHAWHRRQL